MKINLVYEPKEVCQRGFNPTVRNVYLDNVNCKKSKYGVMIEALDEECNVYNIEVKDCDFDGVTSGGNSITGKSDDIRLHNVSINGKK